MIERQCNKHSVRIVRICDTFMNHDTSYQWCGYSLDTQWYSHFLFAMSRVILRYIVSRGRRATYRSLWLLDCCDISDRGPRDLSDLALLLAVLWQVVAVPWPLILAVLPLLASNIVPIVVTIVISLTDSLGLPNSHILTRNFQHPFLVFPFPIHINVYQNGRCQHPEKPTNQNKIERVGQHVGPVNLVLVGVDGDAA